MKHSTKHLTPKITIRILCFAFCLISGFTLSAQKNLPDPEGLSKSGLHKSDCVATTPGNNIMDSVFPHCKFVLSHDSLNSYSWVNFKNGDKLLLINSSCTSYSLIFQFTTSRYKADTNDYKFWYPKAVELMKEVVKGVYDEPLHLKTGIDTLDSFTRNYPDSLKLGLVIYYNYDHNPPDDVTSSPDSYQQYMDMFPHVFINNIEKLSGDKYMIEIDFSISLGGE